jgi:hypothetical protein
MRPKKPPVRLPSALSSDGTGNAACCGRQLSGAPLPRERRGLTCSCPACRTSRAIDIRILDRHPLASVGSLVLGLAVLVVSGRRSRQRAFASAHRIARITASRKMEEKRYADRISARSPPQPRRA